MEALGYVNAWENTLRTHYDTVPIGLLRRAQTFALHYHMQVLVHDVGP